jgi:energy-coupling factor transporter transmembrane protein EcfT
MQMTTTRERTPRLHAATLLAVWLMWLLGGQGGGATGHDLWIALSLIGALALAPRRFFRLAKRLRWLFLAILITFALGTPGRLVVADLAVGPTFEGLIAAVRSMANLAAMAACVSVLLEHLTPTRLTGAMHRLLHPMSACHPAPDSFALRLQLVLRDIEHPLPGRQWMSWLEDRSDAGQPVAVESCAPFGGADFALLTGALLLLAAWMRA